MSKQTIGRGTILLFLSFISLVCASLSEGAKLQVRVNAGGHYTHNYRWGVFNFHLVPQMALWLEDEKGTFAGNIYITYRSATSKWVGGKDIRRPAALPIWSHKQGIPYKDGLYMPDREHPLPDAVTGATPKQSFTKEWRVPEGLPPWKYVIKAEVNNSFDYNEKYKKDLPENDPDFNAENGQPSVIYKGEMIFGPKGTKISLTPCGHGHPTGKDGKIYTNMKGVTDAWDIAESIEVEYIPEKR
jgi:hypothetical protein